jgi:hypothetical protein
MNPLYYDLNSKFPFNKNWQISKGKISPTYRSWHGSSGGEGPVEKQLPSL